MTTRQDTPAAGAYFTDRTLLAPIDGDPRWDLLVGDGPVVATAIHDGHALRDSLHHRAALDRAGRLREEDPMTGLLADVGDVRLRVRHSRFEVDVNRPRDGAVYARPEDAWGLQVWEAPLPEDEQVASLRHYDRFYAMVRELFDRLLARHGTLLLVDLHSYNHRRDGADAAPADPAGNPDIELGLTTLDHGRWGHVATRFTEVLAAHPVAGRAPDVRANVRFPTGGHFPEWVYATWGDRICTISPEYKKIFMDEWTGHVDLAALHDLRTGLAAAVAAVRPEFGK